MSGANCSAHENVMSSVSTYNGLLRVALPGNFQRQREQAGQSRDFRFLRDRDARQLGRPAVKYRPARIRRANPDRLHRYAVRRSRVHRCARPSSSPHRSRLWFGNIGPKFPKCRHPMLPRNLQRSETTPKIPRCEHLNESASTSTSGIGFLSAYSGARISSEYSKRDVLCRARRRTDLW